jgi:hypothetical protein
MAKVALAGDEQMQPSDFSQMEKPIGIRMGSRCCLWCLFVAGIAAERRNLSGSVLCDQRHAEACFALPHTSVSISSLFE